jgi:hypothetical protein
MRRRRLLPRRRAAQSLAAGGCLFAPVGGCDESTKAQPLTLESLVLCCDTHLPRLLELRHDLAETRRVERYLGNRFLRSVA